MLARVRAPLRRADIAAVNLEGTLGAGGIPKCPPGKQPDVLCVPGARLARARRCGAPGSTSSTSPTTTPGTTAPRAWARPSSRCATTTSRLTGRPGEITYMNLRRARVAFIGFSAYPWTSSIRDLPGAQALIREAGRPCQRRRRVHPRRRRGRRADPHARRRRAGLRRASAATRGPSPTPPSTPAPTSCWAPARTSCAALELYRDRLIAYSLGNLAGWHNFSLRRGASAAQRPAARAHRPPRARSARGGSRR